MTKIAMKIVIFVAIFVISRRVRLVSRTRMHIRVARNERNRIMHRFSLSEQKNDGGTNKMVRHHCRLVIFDEFWAPRM